MDNRRIMEAVRISLEDLKDFKVDALNAATKKVAADLGLKIGLVVHPLRLACTGRTVGPSLYHLIEILGRDRVLARLDRFIVQCAAR